MTQMIELIEKYFKMTIMFFLKKVEHIKTGKI